MATVKVLSQNLSKGTSENHRTQDFLRFQNGVEKLSSAAFMASKIVRKIEITYVC